MRRLCLVHRIRNGEQRASWSFAEGWVIFQLRLGFCSVNARPGAARSLFVVAVYKCTYPRCKPKMTAIWAPHLAQYAAGRRWRVFRRGSPTGSYCSSTVPVTRTSPHWHEPRRLAKGPSPSLSPSRSPSEVPLAAQPECQRAGARHPQFPKRAAIGLGEFIVIE